MGKRSAVIGLVLVVVVAGVVGVAWFLMRDGDQEARGSMGQATYEISAEPDNDGLEISFDLQGSAPGEEWQVSIEHDGTEVTSGTRVTDEDSELDAGAFVPDGSPEDEIVVKATDPDGETHTASLNG